MAILCAVVLLFVGFTHSVSHFDATVTGYSIQANLVSGGDSPDASRDDVISVNHCQGCSHPVTLSTIESVGPVALVATFPGRPRDSIRAHTARIKTPPPISTI